MHPTDLHARGCEGCSKLICGAISMNQPKCTFLLPWNGSMGSSARQHSNQHASAVKVRCLHTLAMSWIRCKSFCKTARSIAYMYPSLPEDVC